MRTEPVSSTKTFFYMCLICIAACTALAPGSAAAARFEYAPFVTADDRVYVETAPLTGFIGDVKKFYTALRGPQAENEVMLLGNALRAKIGINPMDPDHLNAAGVQADRPLGMAFEKIDALSKKKAVPAINAPKIQETPGQWTVFLPSRNSATLYNNLKLLFEKTKQGAPGKTAEQQQPAAPAVREITPGRLFLVNRGRFFVGRGGRFVVLASTQKRALASVKEAARPISKSDGFAAFRHHISSRYKDMNATMLSYVNNRGVGAPYLDGLFRDAKGKAAEENPIVKEGRENIVCEAGVWVMDAAGLRVHNDSLYAPGFFADGEKLLPLLLNNQRQNVSADHHGKDPAVYGNISLSTAGLMRVIEKIQPDAMRGFDTMNQQFRQETGRDIRADLIEGATGNLSLLVTRLPDFNDAQALDKWEMSLHMGYRPGKRADIAKIFDIIAAAEQNRGGDTKYVKEKIGGEDVWSIITMKRVPRPSSAPKSLQDRVPGMDPQQQQQQDESQQQQQQQQQQAEARTVTTTTYLHLGADEAVISFNRKHLEAMLPKKFERVGAPIATRLMGVAPADLDRTFFMLYMKVDAVIDVVKSSPFILFAAPMMPYLQNMRDVTVASKHEGDVIYSTFNLKLKEGAGFH